MTETNTTHVAMDQKMTGCQRGSAPARTARHHDNGPPDASAGVGLFKGCANRVICNSNRRPDDSNEIKLNWN